MATPQTPPLSISAIQNVIAATSRIHQTILSRISSNDVGLTENSDSEREQQRHLPPSSTNSIHSVPTVGPYAPAMNARRIANASAHPIHAPAQGRPSSSAGPVRTAGLSQLHSSPFVRSRSSSPGSQTTPASLDEDDAFVPYVIPPAAVGAAEPSQPSLLVHDTVPDFIRQRDPSASNIRAFHDLTTPQGGHSQLPSSSPHRHLPPTIAALAPTTHHPLALYQESTFAVSPTTHRPVPSLASTVLPPPNPHDMDVQAHSGSPLAPIAEQNAGQAVHPNHQTSSYPSLPTVTQLPDPSMPSGASSLPPDGSRASASTVGEDDVDISMDFDRTGQFDTRPVIPVIVQEHISVPMHLHGAGPSFGLPTPTFGQEHIGDVLMNLDGTSLSRSGPPAAMFGQQQIHGTLNANGAGTLAFDPPTPLVEREDIDTVMNLNGASPPSLGPVPSTVGQNVDTPVNVSGAGPSDFPLQAPTTGQQHVDAPAHVHQPNPSASLPPATTTGQEPDSPSSSTANNHPLASTHGQGAGQGQPITSLVTSISPPSDPFASSGTGLAETSAASDSNIIAAVRAIVAPIFPRLTGLESSVHTLLDRREPAAPAVSEEFVSFETNTSAPQPHLSAGQSGSTPSTPSPRKRPPVIRPTSDSVGPEINLFNVFLREFLLEQGVIHQTHYGRQPPTLPSLPATPPQLDLDAPRFDYTQPLRTCDYNTEVALYLGRLVIRQLPTVGARHAGFMVTALMHNEEVVMNLIYVRADETKKHFRQAGPAMEPVRTRSRARGRRYARKGTLLKNRRDAANVLSGFARFVNDGQDMHPDFGKAHQLLQSVAPDAMSSDESDGDNPKNIKIPLWRSAAFGLMVECLDTWLPFLRSRQLMGTRGHPPASRVRSHGLHLVSSNVSLKQQPRVIFDDVWYNAQHSNKRRTLASNEGIEIPLIPPFRLNTTQAYVM